MSRMCGLNNRKRETLEILIKTKGKVMDEVKDYFAVGEKEYRMCPLALLVVEMKMKTLE
jgi:hypothetical protein